MTAPIVLVHGIRLPATMWRPHVRRLTPDFHVRTPDLPGHGTRAARPFTLDGAVAAVHEAVLEAREATGRRPLLLGLSLGGYVSLAHTARHPDDVAALVLHGCTARTDGPLPALYAALGRAFDRLGPERAAALNARVLRRALPAESADAVLAGGLTMPAFGQAVAELRRTDFLPLARELTTPTLYLNGRADLPFRADERRFHAATRHSRLFHTPGGHLLALQHPARFATLIRRAHHTLLPGDTRETFGTRTS
ncbi:alpha/beta fold hydrolase [Kitasatospora sp. NPDC059673]|uniref:alpha/beta fold hydrolase n=1 Tax=Kitasatospora sp. NPDC059673 TaxID=3346901 RepID=UPI00368AF1FA